jgi:oxygen-independent coproporphyrinogen-3 oxidase
MIACSCYHERVQTPFSEPRAAYIHVPFCAHRCGYCDFTLVAGKDHLSGDFLRALARELAGLERPRDVDTLFFGGGTPTHLRPEELRSLCELARAWFKPADGCEFSVEANPADLTGEKVSVLADSGVNRVSLGVQSFAAAVLQLLERDHREQDVLGAVERLRRRIDNIAVDLIFGVPGQSLDLWRETLERAVRLEPRHISTYGLTWEKGTSFWTRRARGDLVPVADELERAMYGLAMDFLPAHGYLQYELSNFARPGGECRHNETYWQGLAYFGVGPGAASYMDGTRRTRHRSVTTWLQRVLSGRSGVHETETLSPEHRAREAIMLGLRRTSGIDRGVFRARFGIDLDALAGPAIQRLTSAGLVEDSGEGIRLSLEGRFIADSVIVEFL